MSVAFNQDGDTIAVGISVDSIGVEQEITIPGGAAELLISNLAPSTVFVSDTTAKAQAGMPVFSEYVVVIANPGTLYVTAYGQGTVYITPGASA